jgi:23S rRNA (uracil1939-C5)-methyltransferase
MDRKQPVKIAEKYKVKITDMTQKGQGVGKIDAMTVFVEGLIVGDIAEIEIIQVKKSYAIGKVVNVIEKSIFRVEETCQYINCGGCQLQAMNYSGQLQYKQKQVKNALQRIGGFESINMNTIIAMENPVGYRNKAQYKICNKGLGFYEKGSHNVVPIKKCLNQPQISNSTIKIFNSLFKNFPDLTIYDEITHKGLIRGIVERTNQKDEIYITIIINGKDVPNIEKVIDYITSKIPEVIGININYNTQKSNVIIGKKSKHVYGEKYLTEKIGDISYYISPESFFQVNTVQMEKLYHTVKIFAGLTGREILLDLYCGAGTIGLYLANQAKKVYGIEVVERAIKDAKYNAEKNYISNAEFVAGKAEKEIDNYLERRIVPDVVIVDPPRKGCDTKLINTLLNIKAAKIIYVSCNPATLARDLKLLCSEIYKIEKVQPVDMFPNTTHVETVVLMSRVKVNTMF